MNRTAVACGLLLLPIAASAHHSLTEFARGVEQEIEAEVLRVLWSNPHIRLTLRTQNENGEQETWELTGRDLNILDRRNVPRDLERVGGVSRVAGSQLDYRLTITDPETFSEPAVYERYWLALGEDLQAYNCQTY